MFDRKELLKKVEEQEQKQKQNNQEPELQEPADVEYDGAQEERASRLRDMMQSENKWSTQGLKPNTRRKKIGLACLIIGLAGYLIIQYVLRR